MLSPGMSCDFPPSESAGAVTPRRSPSAPFRFYQRPLLGLDTLGGVGTFIRRLGNEVPVVLQMP